MKRKNNKGITLISLIVTTIVLIILASVSIGLIFGENNLLIGKAKEGTIETNKQMATEKINLKITNSQMNSYADSQRMPTLQELADDFCEDEEIEYVELKSKKIASLEKIEVNENDSFFTKLKEYPYEFEINSSLQLASIDGIKIATKDETIQDLKMQIEELKKQMEEQSQSSNIKNAKCIYQNSHNTDASKKLTYTSTVKGPVLVVISGGSRNVNQSISLACTCSSEIQLINSYAKNSGNSDGKGWTCVRTSIYLIPNISEGDIITATGAAYTGFPVFYMQVIQLGNN